MIKPDPSGRVFASLMDSDSSYYLMNRAGCKTASCAFNMNVNVKHQEAAELDMNSFYKIQPIKIEGQMYGPSWSDECRIIVAVQYLHNNAHLEGLHEATVIRGRAT